MPIFREDLGRRESAAQSSNPAMAPAPGHCREENSLRKQQPEANINTELREDRFADSPGPLASERDLSTPCSNRSELIERLKRGESPTWRPSRHSEAIWDEQPSSPPQSPKRSSPASSMLLPSAAIASEKKRGGDSDEEARRRDGMGIERPRSALHSGDFTQDEQVLGDTCPARDGQRPPGLGDVGHSWFATSPPRDFAPFRFEKQRDAIRRPDEAPASHALLSSSISSSFVYKPPTSPLVQSETNEDVDLASPMDDIDIRPSLSISSRRHTAMPSSLAWYGFPHSPSPGQSMMPFRQERAFPYQAHQPRRSLASTPNFSSPPTSMPVPQSPALLRSRRPSFGSDMSPLQHASMVGSYEESILRGRMSTTPSKPLDFLAQIGVLGLGKCKSSLRCPPHVTLPFPAVFYSYASSSHGLFKVEDGPSPYVGQIDLENGLPNPGDDARSRRKAHSRAAEGAATGDDAIEGGHRPVAPSEFDHRRAPRPKRRSGSPKAPPGGSYRIPEKGQIQIIIKNPNKTAVKLFLIPYDLAGMEAGTKTFIRQRSYSAGPIIDNMPETNDDGIAGRPILRYLIHLHICCPSRSRYYLYKSIRVVFANRVPDGKEKLRNEITLPEPRFTSYRPIRAMHPPILSGTGPGANLAAEKAFRRRSSGLYIGAAGHVFDAAGAFSSSTGLQQSFPPNLSRDNVPTEPLPPGASNGRTRDVTGRRGYPGPANIHSPDSSQTSRPTTRNSSGVLSWDGADGQIDRYDKLSRGDVGYGGNAFANLINGNTGVAESLLSQRLRSLGVQGQANRESGATQD
ncbi:hypothetical protein GGS23DRAFT_557570 [Durotheca rogersii]|uniref:uncharacterized protein n=1 Tax=Durotheca rogersii TaxID=419775 RepID=UPI00221EF3EA|nr:uncharacterized protein GGS23DRAFT_557570 [Durotheca rogersii]KAI5865077.1 hypothetical protein GGS23DRAFT_557570 [Durotheca rogersii]